MQTLFSWVHLSDLQHGHGDEHGHALVMERLRADIAEAPSRGCPMPDALLVTGDVAFGGSAAEYVAAQAWLGKVGEAAGGVGEKNMFVVPGNHDVDRSGGNRHARLLAFVNHLPAKNCGRPLPVCGVRSPGLPDAFYPAVRCSAACTIGPRSV